MVQSVEDIFLIFFTLGDHYPNPGYHTTTTTTTTMANERAQLLIQMDETTNTQAPKERPSLLRMCFAELIGTMVVILFGNGCVAQAVL